MLFRRRVNVGIQKHSGLLYAQKRQIKIIFLPAKSGKVQTKVLVYHRRWVSSVEVA